MVFNFNYSILFNTHILDNVLLFVQIVSYYIGLTVDISCILVSEDILLN